MNILKKVLPVLLFISTFSIFFFPSLLYAQSTPWSFYNNPLQSNAMDVFYNGVGAANPAVRIKTNGQISLGTIQLTADSGLPSGGYTIRRASAMEFRGGTAGYSFINNANTANLMTILDNGSVGIRTNTPAANLTIQQSSDGQGSGGLRSYNIAGTSSLSLFQGGDNNTYLGNFGAGGLTFYTNSFLTQNMFLATSGNVGIGTTNPTARLSLGSALANTKLAVYDDGTYTYGFGIQPSEFRFHAYGAGADFRFYNAPAGTPLFTIKGTGNVGIGQTSPQGRLDISTNGGSDGLVITQQAENSQSIQGYIDGNWATRTSYAGGCCNALLLQPDVGGVGIGIPATLAAPYYPIQAKLDILAAGDDTSPVIRMRQSNAPNYGIDLGIDNNVDGGLYFRNVNNGASAVAMVIRRDNGYVGIGGISPSYHLHVNGNGYISGDLTVNTLVTNSLPAANSPQPLCRDGLNGRTGACPSDQRLKENIHPLSVKALDLIKRLKPSTFNFKNGGDKQSGFIAQEVLDVIPEAVGKSSDGYYTLNDMILTPYLVKAAQELDEKNNQLEDQISVQQKQINELKDLISKLESKINGQ